MTTRRQLLTTGLAALGYGLSSSPPIAGAIPAIKSLTPPWSSSNPVRWLTPWRPSVYVDGLPFEPWFTGDDWMDPNEIPFHVAFQDSLPPPTETVEVAVVGGGLSGLTAAYELRDKRPVVFEVHPRFGGNAQGESWRGSRFSLGSAYVITPDPGTYLNSLYNDLGLQNVRRESYPPDPMELGGKIRDDFWEGAEMSDDERKAFREYARVVREMANQRYPEIPLTGSAAADDAVRALDRQNFRENVEEQMGMPLTPLLAAGIQAYFYSSFGAGMEFISAAAGWNFVAAEEFGRWVFPGGNSYMARALWTRLQLTDLQGPSGSTQMMRPECTVVDVRRAGEYYQVTWLDAQQVSHSLRAKYVVMAGSKHIAKYVLHDLATIDPEKFTAMAEVETMSYAMANVLLDAPIQRDFYDLFRIGDESFPMTPSEFEANSKPVDILDGNYAQTYPTNRNVLTLYWPLPWFTARFSLLVNDPWQTYAAAATGPTREALRLMKVDESAVKQIRLTRWGHAMPLAKPFFIDGGSAEHLIRPFDGQVFFANQDNWALPAVENSLIDAKRVADEIRALLS